MSTQARADAIAKLTRAQDAAVKAFERYGSALANGNDIDTCRYECDRTCAEMAAALRSLASLFDAQLDAA